MKKMHSPGWPKMAYPRVRDSRFEALRAFQAQLRADPALMPSDTESDSESDAESDVDVGACFYSLPLVSQVQLSMLSIKFQLKNMSHLTDEQSQVIREVTGEKVGDDTRAAIAMLHRHMLCSPGAVHWRRKWR